MCQPDKPVVTKDQPWAAEVVSSACPYLYNMVSSPVVFELEHPAMGCYQEELNLMVQLDLKEVGLLEDPEVQQEAEVPGKAHISQMVPDKDLHPHHPEECYTHPVHPLVEQQVYIWDLVPS